MGYCFFPGVLLVIYFLFLHGILGDGVCYYPNGDVADDIPCDPSASISACCGKGWTCLVTGACEYTQELGNPAYARGSCTDYYWTSPDCPLFCYGESVQVYPSPNHSDFDVRLRSSFSFLVRGRICRLTDLLPLQKSLCTGLVMVLSRSGSAGVIITAVRNKTVTRAVATLGATSTLPGSCRSYQLHLAQ